LQPKTRPSSHHSLRGPLCTSVQHFAISAKPLLIYTPNLKAKLQSATVLYPPKNKKIPAPFVILILDFNVSGHDSVRSFREQMLHLHAKFQQNT